MTLFRLFLCSVLATLLTACATQAPSQLEAGIKTVAVISLVPESAPINKLSVTVFSNQRAEIDFGGQIEQAIWETSVNRLAVSRPSWVVKKVSYDRAALLKSLRVGAWGSNETGLGQFAAENGLDAVIVYTEAFY